MHMFYSNNGLV